ncbi:hypothetical protein BJX63DRAFT_445106 [Aspergillus granulosus]|uniref:Uncharacterized protein n=1 Tax=Aspergillus granulosus TaxID=176169 RepID=A0ABR4H2W3_9EURO
MNITETVIGVAILTMMQACMPKTLFDILRDRPRDLLVHPLQWKLHHLEVVGCRFDNVEPPAYLESTHKDHKDAERGKPDDAEGLACNPFPDSKHRCLYRILVGEGRRFARTRKGSRFYFQGRPVHRPRYTVFHRHETPFDNRSPPLVGYIHYTSINGDRWRHFKGRSLATKGTTQTGANSYHAQLALTTPEDWTEDPYFLFILLALGQLQHRLRPSEPIAYISRLLVTNLSDRDSILLCEAEITISLLNALRNLKTAIEPIIRLVIRRKKIPYKPYDTFADRLTDELVASNPPDHVNHASSHKTKRCHEKDDTEDDCGSRIIHSPLSIRRLQVTRWS